MHYLLHETDTRCQVSSLEAQLAQTQTALAESQRTAAARLEELRRCSR